MSNANSPKLRANRSSAHRATPAAGQTSETWANLRVVQSAVVQEEDSSVTRQVKPEQASPGKQVIDRSAPANGNRESKQPVSGSGQSDKELDMELVHRVQRGDKSGFDLLVLRYQNKILNLISRYVHDPHEACLLYTSPSPRD